MPKKRLTDEQIASALRQAEAGTTIGETCRNIGPGRVLSQRSAGPALLVDRSAYQIL